MNCLTEITKLPFEHVVAAEANNDLDDHEDRIYEHPLVRQENPPTKGTRLEHPERSNQKSILERSFPQRTMDNPHSQGLLIHLPKKEPGRG